MTRRGAYDTDRKATTRVETWTGRMTRALDAMTRTEMRCPVRKWDLELMARITRAQDYLDRRRQRSKHATDPGRKR